MATDRYEQWFKAVDTDGSGSLTYSELYDFLTQQRGYTDKQVEVRLKFTEFSKLYDFYFELYASIYISFL